MGFGRAPGADKYTSVFVIPPCTQSVFCTLTALASPALPQVSTLLAALTLSLPESPHVHKNFSGVFRVGEIMWCCDTLGRQEAGKWVEYLTMSSIKLLLEGGSSSSSSVYVLCGCNFPVSLLSALQVCQGISCHHDIVSELPDPCQPCSIYHHRAS